MDALVITHPNLDGARAVVHPDSLPGWEAVGWQSLGPWCGVPDSLATADELAAEQTPDKPTPRKRRPAAESE